MAEVINQFTKLATSGHNSILEVTQSDRVKNNPLCNKLPIVTAVVEKTFKHLNCPTVTLF
jgi:hypothetical protein